MTLKIGDIVVLFRPSTALPGGAVTISHNSREANTIGGNGCRGRVTRIGRKLAYISSGGADWPVVLDRDASPTRDFALPIDEARELHRQNFSAPDEWRSPEMVDDIVNRL